MKIFLTIAINCNNVDSNVLIACLYQSIHMEIILAFEFPRLCYFFSKTKFISNRGDLFDLRNVIFALSDWLYLVCLFL